MWQRQVFTRRTFRGQHSIVGATKRCFHSEKQTPKQTARFWFDAHAACKGKRCNWSTVNPPPPDSCGEDSYFISENIVGVTDGVGGWNNVNVNPAAISRRLMSHAADIAKTQHASPLQVLTAAYERVLADPQVEAGSTTACIVRLIESPNNTPVLQYANLGDSGFVIIRNNEVIFRSEFQSIGPAPFQLAKIPPRLRDHGAIESKPHEAGTGEIILQEGDLIVLATDGVWDNFAPDLRKHEAFFPPMRIWFNYWHGPLDALVDVVSKAPEGSEAKSIVETAIRHNMKPDDVTAVVVRVRCKSK